MNLATFFPYRNDVRKILIPYLKELTVEQWYATHSSYPNSIAWIVEHITRSEDEWINVIALQVGLQLPPKLTSPQQLLQAYIDVRNQTDFRLKSILFDENAPAIQLPTYSDGWQPPSPPTLHWIFHHVFDHETYHVGQIGVISRLNGFAGPSF